MKKLIFSIVLVCLLAGLKAQSPHDGKILDEIVAIIGDNYVLKTDIDKEIAKIETQDGIAIPEEQRYEILNSLIAKKMLLYQAQLDSVTIPDERVDSEVERRMMYILAQFPRGEEDFVKQIGESVEEFKAKNRATLYEEMLVDEMKQKILKDVKITPNEVIKYYKAIPKDSLPYIDAEVTLAQIVRYPKITAAEKEYALRKAEQIRRELEDGADFCITAQLESDDLSNSGKCGELGFFGRGQMVPEFEATAFRLKPDTLSKIVETRFGYHILKLVERRGERVNVRHILKMPKTVMADLLLQKNFLETTLDSVRTGKLTFEAAAKKYSDDEATSSHGGKLSDRLGNFKVTLDELDPDAFSAVGKMKVGEYLGPIYFKNEHGQGNEKEYYKIFYLVEESEPHVADLNRDWLKIQSHALEKKKAETLENWIMKNKRDFYIKLNDKYAHEPILQHWNKKN